MPRGLIPRPLGRIKFHALLLAAGLLTAKGIRNEEAVLDKELDGYIEYKEKVRYRIIPFIW